MNKLLLDSNIFLRFITADGPAEHLKVARNTFDQIQHKRFVASVHTLTLHEVIYVGIHVYQLDKTKLVTVLEQLLSLKNLEIHDVSKQAALKALKLFKHHSLDWPDCLLSVMVADDDLDLASFDHDFAKIGLENKGNFVWIKK